MKPAKVIGLTLLASFLVACEGLPVREVRQTLEGTYDVETRYDMKTVAGTFSGFAGQWARPDEAIHQEIIAGVRESHGDQIANTFESVYGSQLQQDITGYLNEQAPPWVMNLENSLEDVDQQLGKVDMQASWLYVEKENGTFEATQIWNGFSVFEDPDCPDSDAILCNQLQITSEELLEAEYPVEVISSTYEAVDQGETVALESHSVEFSYGRLGLYLLTNLILPDQKTSGVGLRDVVLAAINCRGLAGRIAGDDGTLGVNVGGVNVGISLDDLIGNCEDSVFGMTTRFVDRFNAPVAMDLSGTAQIIDTNRDGRIDQLTGGDLGGNMTLTTFNGQAEEGPVDGLFTGFRVGDVD
jgi:hypothetical protein